MTSVTSPVEAAATEPQVAYLEPELVSTIADVLARSSSADSFESSGAAGDR